MLAAVAVGLVSLHRAARERLDETFGQRLEGIAVTAAYLADPDSVFVWSFDPQDTDDLARLRERFERIRRDNGLAEVSLCDADGFVIISASRSIIRGDYNTFWALDQGAVDVAKGGFASSSMLYDQGGLVQKSAHAPVINDRGTVIGVVSVEAEADFFGALTTLRGGAWLTGGVVLVVLSILLIALARLLRDIVRYRASLAEQEKLAAMGRMTAGIAHEIRNPLGIMRGAGEALQQRLEGQGQDATLAGFVIDEVDRLDGILTRYLTFGRGGGLTCAPHDLETLIRSTLRNLREELDKAGVKTSCTVRDALRPVTIDPAAIQQLLINLVLNARDAVTGAEDPRVEIVLDHAGDSVMMTVTDTGPGLGGIDPETLFTPFHTTKEKGSGLGLSVVRQVAEDHGGRVRIADRGDGSGAVVTVTLPYAGPAEEGS